MRSSSKHGAENNRGISSHMFTLHQRLHHALNLGLRNYNYKERKWHSTDIEIQRLAVRSIDVFLDCITSETSQHPFVKDSVADMVKALEGILLFKNESVLRLTSCLTVKMINVLPYSVLQSHVLDLVHPLSSLLSSHQLEVSVSCATALSMILSNLSSVREGEVWEILIDANTVVNTIRNIQDFVGGNTPIEYLQEMVSLLSKILWRWPSSSFCIWTDAKVMEVLDSICLQPDISVKVSLLQLYSTIALCVNGAKKLLENGKTILPMMVHCMGSTNLHSIQMEGFKLAQCFAISKQRCLKMLEACGKILIQAISSVMSSSRPHSGKLAKNQMSVLLEACYLAMMITHWAGEHHSYFWELRVDKILLDLLVNNFHKTELQHPLSLKELIATAQEGLNKNLIVGVRPYIWDILGGLAAHCSEDLNSKMHGNDSHIKMLITCACMTFMDSIRSTRQICQNDIVTTFGNEAASRAVLLMISSPCKYFASQARTVLSEILKPSGKEDLKYLLNTVDAISSGDKFRMSDNLQMVINLISLACYSSLPQYQKQIIRSQGIKTLVSFISWWLSSPLHIKRSSIALHLHNHFNNKACCYDYAEDWEGEEMLLLFGLWGLAEMIHYSFSLKHHADMYASQMNNDEAQLVIQLEQICGGPYAPGPRWYAAYILSYFGHYGFPNKLGQRIGKALTDIELNDLKLILTNQESVSVHTVILMVRCPSLLPPGEMPLNEITTKASFARSCIEAPERLTKEIRLSAHVDHQALSKLLEFVYSGYLHAREDLVKKLKIFAKHCNLQDLLQLLCRRSPKWGTPIPSYDLMSALGLAGLHISDIILEAKVNKFVDWACNTCCLSGPHMHVHKVILSSSCDYLRALFQSGMQESHSQTIKVPVSWEALVKLVSWFYSAELPVPVSGCLWDHLDAEEKLHELQTYLELCWLAEFWLLENLHEECSNVIVACLDSARHLSAKILKLAASLSQWKLAEVAADYVAPLYQRLRNSGELEELDEELIDMVRAASVRLSQKKVVKTLS